MKAISFLAKIRGNVSEIRFLVFLSNYLLYILVGNLYDGNFSLILAFICPSHSYTLCARAIFRHALVLYFGTRVCYVYV